MSSQSLVQFCEYQLVAKGTRKSAYCCDSNDSEAQLFCGAHLADGRAFPCPYSASNIYFNEESDRFKVGFDEGLPCGDFKLSDN